MRVEQIMTCPTVVGPNATILSVAKLMHENDVGAVLIQDADLLCGIATDRDIAKHVSFDQEAPLLRPVAEIMSPQPFTCHKDMKIAQAAHIMADHQVRRLPVLDDFDHLVGLLTIDDIAENFSEHLAGETLGEVVDKHLRRPLRSEQPFPNKAKYPVPNP